MEERKFFWKNSIDILILFLVHFKNTKNKNCLNFLQIEIEFNSMETYTLSSKEYS